MRAAPGRLRAWPHGEEGRLRHPDAWSCPDRFEQLLRCSARRRPHPSASASGGDVLRPHAFCSRRVPRGLRTQIEWAIRETPAYTWIDLDRVARPARTCHPGITVHVERGVIWDRRSLKDLFPAYTACSDVFAGRERQRTAQTSQEE
ncbi:hypothetical protein NDU88_004191 [Pleurodeles waltl]|uniref:Uncharacterized protein n=1 Tax=Pleurodeles waltl TaxID=8319 RepID=A0AAV7TTG7_PLEWA|nr:hypothetical protein NDU88_004191 [Pleurodeles waltl]